MRLSPERRAELLNELRLRRLFTNKMLCRRYGVSLSTLKRLQAEALERPLDPMGRIGPETVRVVLPNRDGPGKVKAA
jgi:hypothetical protein